MTPRMNDAVDAYQSTSRPMVEICLTYGVSRRGLSTHIKRLGISRQPGIIHRGGGSHRGKIGPAHPCWKDGHSISNGYATTYLREYAWSRKRKNHQILEHIRLMELHLGRQLLPNECVHHKDLNRLNNAFDNLQLMSRGEHSRLHRLLEAAKRRLRAA